MASIFSNGIEKAHERRIEQLRKECTKEGVELVDVKNVTLEEVSSAKASLGSSLTALTGGKVGYDFLQVYTLSYNNQLQYYLQPFNGLTPLPGQHFICVPFSLSNPIQYRIKKNKNLLESIYQGLMNSIPFVSSKAIRVCEWLCENNELQAGLYKTKLPTLKELSHVWMNGATKIELDWTVQACAINKNSTLVTMKTGRYGKKSERTGLRQFMNMTSFVMDLGKNYTGDGTNNVMISNTYLSSYFIKNLINVSQENGEMIYQPNNKIKTIMSKLMKFEDFKKVYLADTLDEKRWGNLEKGALQKFNINKSEVVAAAAMDAMGNMKQAAVFTKDKLYILDNKYELSLDLNDVSTYGGLQGRLETSLKVQLINGDIVEVKVGLISDILDAFFKEYCNII